MKITKLGINDKLPLTCSRTGTCCHGKRVQLNPWELACMAAEKGISTREFRDRYCEFGGIRLRFDGNAGWKGLLACSQYVENFGCSVHLGRPLACRLYPLGRQIQLDTVNYMHEGDQFPCLEGCPEVSALPYLTVGEYLEGQQASKFEKAQDDYLDLMQGLADMAFMLLLDTGLAKSGDKKTLQRWREMGSEHPEQLATRIGSRWVDWLMLPEISDIENPSIFVLKHSELLQQKVQEQFGDAQTNQELHETSVLIMGVALHLASSIGANTTELTEHWINTAKSNGAND